MNVYHSFNERKPVGKLNPLPIYTDQGDVYVKRVELSGNHLGDGPVGNQALIVGVNVIAYNFNERGRMETDLGHIIYKTFVPAIQLAMLRCNLLHPGVPRFRNALPTATQMSLKGMGHPPFSMVRVRIEVPHINRQEELVLGWFDSDNVYIYPSVEYTCRLLYTTFAMKNHFDENWGDVEIPESGSGGFSMRMAEIFTKLNLHYEFLFVRGQHWKDVKSRNDYLLFKDTGFNPMSPEEQQAPTQQLNENGEETVVHNQNDAEPAQENLRPVKRRRKYKTNINFIHSSNLRSGQRLRTLRHRKVGAIGLYDLYTDDDEEEETDEEKEQEKDEGQSSIDSVHPSNMEVVVAEIQKPKIPEHVFYLKEAAKNRKWEMFQLYGQTSGPPEPTVNEWNVGNEYEKMKKTLFVKHSLHNFFMSSKAVGFVPATEEEICFPMAFLACQQRVWRHEILENGTLGPFNEILEDRRETLEFDSNVESLFPVDSHCKFLRSDFKGLICFQNEKKAIPKKRDEMVLYENEKDWPTTTLHIWKWCAIQLHDYVQEVVGRKIDHNDLYDCLSCYSYVFQVYINVYAMEIKGKRIHVEHQYVMKNHPEKKFIAMVLDKEHMYSITSVRDYYRSYLDATRTSFCSFCDFCSTLCRSRKSDLCHPNKCRMQDWYVIPSLDQLSQVEAESLGKVTLFCSAGKEVMQDVCTFCGLVNCQCETVHENDLKRMYCVRCTKCQELVASHYYNRHECFMKARKHKEPYENNKIFVYDIESLQEKDELTGQYIHECILVCLRAVYDERKWSFQDIGSFVDFITKDPQFYGSVILAHNGGGYDHHFVVRYLEQINFIHSTIPRPNSIHKYLMVELSMMNAKDNIIFLDFLMMMTFSLKSIGEAFKLDTQKGDFPHLFSKKKHLNYVGPMPSMESEEDWYGWKQMKGDIEIEESKQYWKKQSDLFCYCHETQDCQCTKPKWDFQKELQSYCWKDVDVLAGACRAFRDRIMEFEGDSENENGFSIHGVDPFRYMTQSQIALALFTEGLQKEKALITHERISDSFCPEQIEWLEERMKKDPQYNIWHAGNFHREYYDMGSESYLTGYCRTTKTAFLYLKCCWNACPKCYANEIATGGEMHPQRNISWEKINQMTQQRIFKLHQNNLFSKVEVRWSHEDTDRAPEKYELMKMRDFFYGGRTEVFAAYARADSFPGEEILHHDVCSLYPFVCSWKVLPIGVPKILTGKHIDRARLNPNHPNRYFGFARIVVKPNVNDFIGILPQRKKCGADTEKLVYDLEEKTGAWHTELIYLAMEHHYEILDIYEIWHWDEKNRSNTFMRGYMEFFLRMKQESEGWLKLGKSWIGNKKEEEITEEEKTQIQEMIFQNNGGFARPRKDKVEKNPVNRQNAKIFLNCLWGKLCQRSPSEGESFVYGYQQYLEILSNPRIDLSSLCFRHVNGFVVKSRFKWCDPGKETNRFINLPIAASVTAHAQVHLMRQMFRIGPERILYCDTDSLIFLWPKNGKLLNSTGLGNWENEHPHQRIKQFWAIAPKCYMMELEDEKEHCEYDLKCKGVRNTQENRQKTRFQEIHRLIEADYEGKLTSPIIAKTMVIHANASNKDISYGSLCTLYGEKMIRTVFSKRNMILREDSDSRSMEECGLVRLVPYGYHGRIQNHL